MADGADYTIVDGLEELLQEGQPNSVVVLGNNEIEITDVKNIQRHTGGLEIDTAVERVGPAGGGNMVSRGYSHCKSIYVKDEGVIYKFKTN